MLIKIKVTPSARANKILGKMADGTLKISLTTAPEKGKANKALIDFLSEEFKILKNQIEIVSGKTSHKKIIKIPDTTQI